MITRRRFLTLTAACLAAPAHAAPVTDWQGVGLGAALSLRLVGAEPAQAARLFRKVEAMIAQIEATASLHRDSALTRLNRDGRLAWPSDDLQQILALADQVHRATDGAFDPTVQPLWQATARGDDIGAAHALIGWERVSRQTDEIRLAQGQALTLNGIAQGWAADRIAALLRDEGFGHALINMGEVQALGLRADGQPWQASIQSPEGDEVARCGLTNRALATSSPRGTLIGAGQPHIMGPKGQAALWSTVSVSAGQAALADALSTAFCLMERPAIDRALQAFPDARLEAAV